MKRNSHNTSVNQIAKRDQITAWCTKDTEIIFQEAAPRKVYKGTTIQGWGYWDTPKGIYLMLTQIELEDIVVNINTDVHLSFDEWNFRIQIPFKKD